MLTNRHLRARGASRALAMTAMLCLLLSATPTVGAQTNTRTTRPIDLTVEDIGSIGTLDGGVLVGCPTIGISLQRGTTFSKSKNCTSPPPPPPPPPPASPQFSRVIQLGDSFASGVGALPGDPAFEFGQHVCANPRYFRDEVTPGIALADDLNIPGVFAGCSGALASTVIPGMELQDQVDQLVTEGHAIGGGTDTLVVYSIGGNDLEIDGAAWVDQLVTCLLPGPDCSPVPSASAWTALRAEVTAAHESVRAAFPNATVRVIGYPMLMNPAAGQPCEIGPLIVGGVDFGLTISATEAAVLDSVNSQLNAELAATAAAFASNTGYDIEFVPPASNTRPGACQSQSATPHVAPWTLNGSDISQNSFHPTEAGYAAMHQDLRDNLGIQPLLDTSAEVHNCAVGSTASVEDPWGTRFADGLAIQATNGGPIHNGDLVLETMTSVDLVVDMIGEPLSGAVVTAHVEAPGASPISVALTPACYPDDGGGDRGVFEGRVTLRTNDPYTSIVARMYNSGGALIASAQSGIASVPAIETRNTLDTVGIRINNSALDELELLAESILEQQMSDAIRGLNDSIWVAQVDLDVTLSPLPASAALPHGGLRASAAINDLQVVVRGAGALEGCNWRIEQRHPLAGSVDLAFSPSAGDALPITLAGVNTTFPGLSLDLHNAATHEIHVCWSHVGDVVAFAGLASANTTINTVLTLAELTQHSWLGPVNEAFSALVDAQVEPLTVKLAEDTAGFDLTSTLSISAFSSDANGLKAAVAVTLPGGPVADSGPQQDIGVSIGHATTSSGQAFDASVFVELATLNRGLALATRPANTILASDGQTTFVNDYDSDGVPELIVFAPTAAPYLLRGPDGAGCLTVCVEKNPPPIRASVFENPAGWTWDRDILLTAGSAAAVTSLSEQPDGTITVTWAPPDAVAASVLASAGGDDSFGGDADDLWAVFGEPDFLGDGALTLAVPDTGLPDFHIGLNSVQTDVTGNTDLQILLDVAYAPPAANVPLCVGLVPTLVGTEGDDILIAGGADDVIHGLGGNDLIEGGGGNDTICGGPGRGLLDGEQGADRIDGGGSDDFIRGGSNDDTVWAAGGDDYIIGDAGKDWLDGAGGDDIIYGQDGSDRGLIGGSGDDYIEGGSGNDYIRGDAGEDTLIGGSNFETFSVDKDTIYGGADNDLIYGGDRDDTLYGEGGDDTIHGGAGQDEIHGGDNNDTIYGGPVSVAVTDQDADVIYGDGGDDHLYGGARGDDIHGGSGYDRAYGESGNDWCDAEYESSC